MLRAVIGLVSGVVATGPMTAAMIVLHRRLPARERYSLPPGEIVAQVGQASGASGTVSRETGSAATLLAHFGYGGAAGAFYGLAEGGLRGPASIKGAGFGLIVWAASYLGLLPATGILAPATAHPPRRNALMIAAHLVWGATLGTFATMLVQEATRLAPEAGPDVSRR